MTTSRLVFKQFRFEIVVLLVALAALGVATLFVSARLAGIDVAGCGSADCTALLDERSQLERLSLPLQELSAVLPIFSGLLVGVAIVGREIERNTAVLAWSMGLSRIRWLSARVLIVGAVIVLGSAIPAIATEALSAAAHPGIDLARSFADASGRGSIVIERALIALAVGVLAGTILGRPLPALLAGGVAVVALVIALQLGLDAWLRAEAVRLDGAGRVADPAADEIIETRFQTPSGSLLTYPEARAALAESGELPEDVYMPIAIGIPADRYLEVTARSAAVSVLFVTVLLGLSAAAVERRRPY